MPPRQAAALTAAAWASGAALFLLSTPGVLLQPEVFQRHFAYEMTLSREGMGLLFEGLPPPLFYHLGVSLPVALEWPLYVVCLVGVAAALRRRRPVDLILLAYLGLNLLLIAISERSYVRYALPLLPVLVILGAAAAVRGEAGPAHRAWSAAVVAALIGALLSSIAHTGAMAAPDSRVLAASHIEMRARGSLVALAGDPWYYTPPVHPSAGSVKAATLFGGPPVWERAADPSAQPRLFELEDFRLLVPPINGGALGVEPLRRHRPDWVVITDYEYEDPLRLKRLRPGYEDETTRMLAYLEAEYDLDREIRPRPRLGPLTWWLRGIPPHDWRYFMPTIRLYRRRGEM